MPATFSITRHTTSNETRAMKIERGAAWPARLNNNNDRGVRHKTMKAVVSMEQSGMSSKTPLVVTSPKMAIVTALFVIGIAFLVSFWMATGSTSLSVGAGASGVAVKEIVVREGDTLWGIAADHGPARRDVRETIHRIRQLNALNDPVIHPGMRLQVPTE